MVNDGGDYDQWYFADMAMDVINGKIPYGVLPGNHDQPTDLFNRYFGFERFYGDDWYGGHYGNTNDNNFQLVSTGSIDFIFMQLQFEPPAEVINWADGILDK